MGIHFQNLLQLYKYTMPKKSKVALVTGATRGIGYNVGREIVKRMPTTTTYMTSRVKVAGFSAILGMELGAAARERAKFVKMDVRATTPLFTTHRTRVQRLSPHKFEICWKQTIGGQKM